MPKLKKPDDLVIEDRQTRDLLSALLGRWGDLQMQQLVGRIGKRLIEHNEVTDQRLKSEYWREGYNTGTGLKAAETFNEMREAQLKRLDESAAIVQSLIGPAVNILIDTTIDTLVEAVSKQETKGVEKKIKAAETQYKRKFRKAAREVFDTAVDSHPVNMESHERYSEEFVARQSIEIIQAIGAGKRDKSKVALVFFGEFDLSKPDAREAVWKNYNLLEKRDRDGNLNKYQDLLKSKGLTYEELLEKAGYKTKVNSQRLD
jgi:hypothetical protein